MPKPVTGYVFALLHTATASGIAVLVAQRQSFRTWSEGRPCRAMVPNWAGQWGLIAAMPLVSQSIEQTVQGAVLAQTGVDLSAPAAADRYRIVRAEPRTLRDADGDPVAVLLLTCLPEGLASFAADAQAKLATRRVRDGVLAAVEVKPVAEALSMIGPCPPPAAQWQRLLAAGGASAPLGRQLAERSTMDAAGAVAAVRLLAQALPGAAAAALTPVSAPVSAPAAGSPRFALHPLGARRAPDGGWYRTYAPGETAEIHAVIEPAEAAPGLQWEGGVPDPQGRPHWRALPLDRLSEPGQPFSVRATLGRRVLEVRLAVVPELIGIEILGGAPAASAAEPRVWLRAVLTPPTEAAWQRLRWYGGTRAPDQPPDRRLVSLRDIAAGGKGLGVELDLDRL